MAQEYFSRDCQSSLLNPLELRCSYLTRQVCYPRVRVQMMENAAFPFSEELNLLQSDIPALRISTQP